MLLVLPAVRGTLREIRFNTDRMLAAVSSTTMATDLADYLVRKGISFREAHDAVGKAVRAAEERCVELHELSLSDFQSAHALFGSDVFEALSPGASVARRDVPGGTGPTALAAQIHSARLSLTRAPTAIV